MNNYNGKIDLGVLEESLKTIYDIQNLVNNTNLSSSFEELEKYFRNINFEHSYCINYKEPLEIIYSDLNDIRSDINRISEIATVVSNSYSSIDTSNDKLSNLIKNAKTSMNDVQDQNITKIDPPVPNEKYGPEIAESEVEEYHDLNDDNPDFDVNETSEKKEEEISPYHASRISREADKYYGNSNEIDLEDYDDSDTQNFDNDDFDD